MLWLCRGAEVEGVQPFGCFCGTQCRNLCSEPAGRTERCMRQSLGHKHDLLLRLCRGVEVKGVQPFGCFVALNSRTQALVHVSELDTAYVASPADLFKIGDKMDVKVLDRNAKGNLQLSR